jgi:phenylacetate-coenzyme A ligase PaaK-like adenylate-forming protein
MKFEVLRKKIFEINSDEEFNDLALEIFHFQYANNSLYRQFVDMGNFSVNSIDHYNKIPFLPIAFFKSFKIICKNPKKVKIFTSSGTSGSQRSKHYVSDLRLYEKSFTTCFEKFYGMPDQFTILALLPSYIERDDSSLVYMVNKLILHSRNINSGFYLDNYEELEKKINRSKEQKILLIGVTFALLDLAENYSLNHPGLIVMETGGMKGRRKEIVRDELHKILCSKFNVNKIHSEYGMTELLSQAYSAGGGIFNGPSWMKVLIRDTNDPKTLCVVNKSGGINIIDLANIHSCSFIATQDFGKVFENGSFEVLGRFDDSDIRGCNLLVV